MRAKWVPCDPDYIRRNFSCGGAVRQPVLELCTITGGNPGPHFHVIGHQHLVDADGIPIEEIESNEGEG